MPKPIYVDFNKDFYENTYDKVSWYNCPNCRSKNISIYSNYCADCGVKLIWNKAEYESLCKDDDCEDLIHSAESF